MSTGPAVRAAQAVLAAAPLARAAPAPMLLSTQPFTDALAKPWFQVLLLVMALGPLLNFAASVRTVFLAAAAGGPRGRFFRLTPLSAEDAFIAGGPTPRLSGARMPVAKLQALQGCGGTWTAAEGGGNATLDGDRRGAAVIGLARPAAVDGFACVVERTKEGGLPPRFRLETSLDGVNFEVASIPPWTKIRVEPDSVWDSEAGGDGWARVVWDLQPNLGWKLDFVGAQGVTAVSLSLAGYLGYAGRGRLGTRIVAVMCALRMAAYMTILASDAWQTVIWGDAKSIAAFYIPRLAVHGSLACFLAWELPGTLDAFLIGVGALNGVYFAERQLDGGDHGTVMSGMTFLVATLGAVGILGRGAQLTMRLRMWLSRPREAVGLG